MTVFRPVDGFDAVGIRADNPSVLTLDGSNTWLIGRDPCWIVDPGPELDAHQDAVAAEAFARGGAGGIALTHTHGDHCAGTHGLRERLGGSVPIGAVDWPDRTETLVDGGSFGPLIVLALPGHSDDHVVFGWQGLWCSGDAVLGAGSVFVGGDLAGYMEGLGRLRAAAPTVILPGHGPLVTDPAATLAAYTEHRLGRERALVAALDAGARGDDALLDAAWSDVPDDLRFAAAFSLGAHLRKLDGENRLPPDVVAPEPPVFGDV